MKVATNMFGAESAHLYGEVDELGLELIGIISPFITLDALKYILTYGKFIEQRIITILPTVNMWKMQIELGKIPGKGDKTDSPLDWIYSLEEKNNPYINKKYLTPIWKEKIYFLKGSINNNDFQIEVHPLYKNCLHTKLFVYDKGFVITSANLTTEGSLERHMELGILITEEDNKLEVKVVKELFEKNWNGEEFSCEAIRNELKK